jgi:hypothetical protein
VVGQVHQHRPMRAFHLLRVKALSISPEETSFQTRGFRAPTRTIQEHLETVGKTFLVGYHAALSDEPVEVLGARLRDDVDIDWQGFAFEGAAMGLSLLDRLSLIGRGTRIPRFLAAPGNAHSYMIHVGVGWTLARIPWGTHRTLSRLDPLLRWLAVDGYGFHEGFFHFDRYAGGRKKPRISSGYWQRAFDQGFGRSLWFVMGTQAKKIAEAIDAFDRSRCGDLWSGVGLAATYAGGGDEDNLCSLCDAAAAYMPDVAQGAAFAVKARQRAGNPTARMRQASEILCGMTASEATAIVDAAAENLPDDGAIPAYEVWRRRIQARMRTETGVARW